MNFEPFTFLFERFTDFLTNQIKILCTDTLEEIKSLQHGVEIAQNLLKDVDEVQRQANLKHELQIKVRQVMAILGEIEDFLDSQTGQGDASLSSHFSVGSLKRKRSAAQEAKEISEKLNNAIQCLRGYQLSSDSPHVIPRRRYQTQPDNFKEEFVVGLKEDVERYIAEVVSTDLAIFGMGGAGKTTTARLVYNHKKILEDFDIRAWVCVSQQWHKNKLLSQICQQVGVRPPGDDESLFLNLKEFLRNNSCFFVLDDVWDVKALLELLPVVRSAGSRVLVTTRNKEILNFPQNDFSIKKIRPLTPEESWDLFAKTIQRNRRGDAWALESEFEQMGKEMLEKCAGLPLAIVALGGLLSSKDTIPEWENIKADVVRRIARHKGSDNDYGVVTEILELSYFDLPYFLKPCFIYLGIFPEDSNIYVNILIQLWTAEGFVKVDQSSCSQTLEKVARDFLDELVHRCMVEIVEKDYGGELSFVRIHDLMRDLCIRKADDWNLFQISPPPSTSTSTFMALKSCRIIIHPQGQTNFDINNLQRLRIRSCIWLDMKGDLNFPLKQLKYLRVLHLTEVDLKKTSGRIGDLILLRYLQLRDCGISMEQLLSITKLRNLLYFTYRSFCWVRMPENMVGGMENLRHLRFSLPVDAVAELGVANKPNLQTLRAFGGEWMAKELPDASIGLKELDLNDIRSSVQLEAVYDFVSNRCAQLHTLYLTLQHTSHIPIEFDLHRMKLRHCASLELAGKIKTLPQHPLELPRRLVKLLLLDSQIGEEEQLKEALAQLGELRYLQLGSNAYVADRLSMIGLAKLQELHLENLYKLKEWRIENGTLCRLEKLKIIGCNKLERLPNEISCINSLKHLKLVGMPLSFTRRLERPSDGGVGGGQDFCLVSNIPSVQLY